MGLYAIFYELFDKHFWSLKHIGLIHLPKIPNLNGQWTAAIKSSHNNTVKNANVTIKQSYSNLSMILKTDESTSESIMATFQLKNPINRKLIYTYRCEPFSTANTSMNTHEGTSVLEILDGDKEMTGHYYNGRGRSTIGEINLKKKD